MKKKEEKNDNKKNIVVLTIITIATMIVVLVGATFAYLAASVQTSDSQNVNVTTSGTNDILLIDAGDDISIEATTENFKSGDGDKTDSTYSAVTLQTTSATEVEYDYKVYFDASGDGSGSNNFEYTSGACYNKSTLSSSSEATYSACTSAGNLWAKVGDADYACYEATDSKASDNFQESSSLCLSKADNMWALDPVTELALDIFKGDTTISSASCTNDGICVDKYRNILTGKTTKVSCESDETNRWIANEYKDGVCYVIDKTYDITELKTVKDIYYDLPSTGGFFDGEKISATNSTVTNYYMGKVTLINLGHNQIGNSNKSLTGHINFEIVPRS